MTDPTEIRRGDVAGAARALLEAARLVQPRPQVTADWPDLDPPTGYAIQYETLRQRQARGEHLVGVKLAHTLRSRQKALAIQGPTLAWLTDAMAQPSGEPLPFDRLIQPRVEPEIAFVLGERLAGPGVTAAVARNAVRSVHCALEVIDSRYRDYRWTMADSVSDNSSSGLFVLGPGGRSIDEVDLFHEGCLLEVDGAPVAGATGAVVHGDPAAALAAAANKLALRGLAFEAGWVVLTGALIEPVAVAPGTAIAAHYPTLGTVTIAGG